MNKNLFRDPKIIGIICGLGMVLLPFTGCKKWLEKKPSNDLSTPETVADLQALLDDKYTFNVYRTPSLPEASADDYFLLQATYDRMSQATKAPYTWEDFSYRGDNDWKYCYFPVYVTNLCLEQLQKISRTRLNEQQWDNIKGSALFYRSYYFLQLTWAYAKAYDPGTADSDPGIVLRTTSDINAPSVRASVKETYNKIINDAKESADLLPNIAVHCLRPSRAAVFGLLARAYLSMRQYDSAWKYADQALRLNNQLINYNGDPDITASLSDAGSPFRQFNKETIFYSAMNSTSSAHFPEYAFIDSVIYAKYADNDLRKIAFFRSNGPYQIFKGNYTNDPIYFFSGITTAEMFLTRAECKARVGGVNHTGDKDIAMRDLDSVLSKRWKPFSYIGFNVPDASHALDAILLERRKELIMRGIRWMDLKRLNKEGANDTLKRIVNGQTYTLPPNDNRYALPIPQDIIELTGMLPNPR